MEMKENVIRDINIEYDFISVGKYHCFYSKKNNEYFYLIREVNYIIEQMNFALHAIAIKNIKQSLIRSGLMDYKHMS